MIILMCAIFFIFLPRDGLQVTGAVTVTITSYNYTSIGKNHLCSDYGKFDIEDENDCKAGAKERGFNSFNFQDYRSSFPKGCFYHFGIVYFNRHSVGSRHHDSSPICRNRNARKLQCNNGGKYIPVSWRCDGYHDCDDNSDEQNCAHVVIGENRLCGDEGKLDIDENDCKKEAEKRGLGLSLYNSSVHPKGCFQIANIFFNRHSVGSRQSDSSPICRNQETDPGTSSDCFTVGGNIIGRKCEFPFIYNKWDDYPYVPASFLRWFPNEIKFERCTDFRNSGRLWCATKVTSDDRYIPGNWGECPDSPICRNVRAEHQSTPTKDIT